MHDTLDLNLDLCYLLKRIGLEMPFIQKLLGYHTPSKNIKILIHTWKQLIRKHNKGTWRKSMMSLLKIHTKYGALHDNHRVLKTFKVGD